MLRVILGSAAVLVLSVGVLVAADEGKKDNTKNKGKHYQAKITKVDPKNGTVTVQMKGKDGKPVTRTFRLTEEVRYVDSTGRVAAADIFENGNYVLVVEEDGHLKELHKKNPKNNAGEKNGGNDKSGKEGK